MKFILAIGRFVSVVLIVMSSAASVTSVVTSCDKIDDCSCLMSDGSGLVNIRSLANTDNKPRFSVTYQPTVTYYYNPCLAFTLQQPCVNVTACLVLNSRGFIALGKPSPTVWSYDTTDKTVKVSYVTTDKTSSTVVKLRCNTGVTTPQFKYIGTDPRTFSYNFELTSSEVCPVTSLSVGSILCITFFSLLFAYFILGFIFTHFVMKAEGADKIPNYIFWSNLPGLITDGFQFVRGKIFKRESYSAI
ncbi:uncharacterized protein LOC141911796 [Tubulanus polymorphus]|uniref:uncharacterized protein LOC141911796 n=1 Tax=Tubulanus polymorphus TaxID=672921 RepID=UPI003DA65600